MFCSIIPIFFSIIQRSLAGRRKQRRAPGEEGNGGMRQRRPGRHGVEEVEAGAVGEPRGRGGRGVHRWQRGVGLRRKRRSPVGTWGGGGRGTRGGEAWGQSVGVCRGRSVDWLGWTFRSPYVMNNATLFLQ
jgi:hypothetical protein